MLFIISQFWKKQEQPQLFKRKKTGQSSKVTLKKQKKTTIIQTYFHRILVPEHSQTISISHSPRKKNKQTKNLWFGRMRTSAIYALNTTNDLAIINGAIELKTTKWEEKWKWIGKFLFGGKETCRQSPSKKKKKKNAKENLFVFKMSKPYFCPFICPFTNHASMPFQRGSSSWTSPKVNLLWTNVHLFLRERGATFNSLCHFSVFCRFLDLILVPEFWIFWWDIRYRVEKSKIT